MPNGLPTLPSMRNLLDQVAPAPSSILANLEQVLPALPGPKPSAVATLVPIGPLSGLVPEGLLPDELFGVGQRRTTVTAPAETSSRRRAFDAGGYRSI